MTAAAALIGAQRSWRKHWKRLGPIPATAAIVLVTFAAFALLTPVLPFADPDATDLGRRLLPPLSNGAPLGTDQLGRDVLSRLAWGTRTSLAVAILAACAAAFIGSSIGLIAGLSGPAADALLMRPLDLLLAFPTLLLALAVIAVLGPSLLAATAAVIVVNVPFFARTVRGATVGLRHRNFIATAQMSGLSNFRILTREVLPNVLPTIVVTAAAAIGWMILETAGLSFLGLGAQPPAADLGSMLGEARRVFFTAPYLAAIPSFVILILALAFNLLGDGIRDSIDPRMHGAPLTRPLPKTMALPCSERVSGLPEEAFQPPSFLDIRGLEIKFNRPNVDVRAIAGVNLTLAPGECLGIVGESGSGKSVTALAILRLLASPPAFISRGKILYREKDLLDADLHDLQTIRGDRIGMIFQDPFTTLNPMMCVGEQIAETIRRHRALPRAAARRAAIALMERVALPDAHRRYAAYPHELSGGQCQRVGIAMAIANAPEVLIADEPTTALDSTTQATILELLKDLQRRDGMAIVLISHDVGIVGLMADRLAIMHNGSIVESGTLTDVLTKPKHERSRALVDAAVSESAAIRGA